MGLLYAKTMTQANNRYDIGLFLYNDAQEDTVVTLWSKKNAFDRL